MKVCPRCQKTYTDDNLNFCLEDGSVLSQAGNAPLPETVLINQPRITTPNQPMGSQPGGQPGAQQASWGSSPQQYSMQPAKKSSKTWVWVLLILGLVAVVCGGGLVGFFAYVASVGNTTTSGRNTYTAPPSPATTPGTKSTSTNGRTDVQEINMEGWVQEFSVFGNTEYTNSEFIMGSKQKGYYYVLVARDTHKYDKADVSVTVRNIDNANSSMGYGLIFHSNPQPLTQDYAFLIDTKKKRYRVVHHQPQKETAVVPWTSSPAIKEGTEANVLEAKDDGDNINLYINGEMVKTIKNVHGYKDGVPGVYSGDAVKAAFSKLEVRK
jgi:hypothetical protein